MAHGEAEHSRADAEQNCLLGGQEQQHPSGLAGKHQRWVCGVGPQLAGAGPTPPGPDLAEDDGLPGTIPRQRAGEQDMVGDPAPDPLPTCAVDRHGWAGAHRHGAVRPRRRASRRDRPPHRWC
jgi:hypothetical protein